MPRQMCLLYTTIIIRPKRCSYWSREVLKSPLNRLQTSGSLQRSANFFTDLATNSCLGDVDNMASAFSFF